MFEQQGYAIVTIAGFRGAAGAAKAAAGAMRSLPAAPVGQRLSVASPHGRCALVLDVSGTVLQRIAIADACGVAPVGDAAFLLTGGRGDVATTAGASALVSDARWHNHITALA
jgi:hypothetical protein